MSILSGQNNKDANTIKHKKGKWAILPGYRLPFHPDLHRYLLYVVGSHLILLRLETLPIKTAVLGDCF
jgi:hypothetical protein